MDTDEINRALGANIRRARLYRGLSQQALADRLGLGRSVIGYYENAVRTIDVNGLAAIARELRFPMASFLPGNSPLRETQ